MQRGELRERKDREGREMFLQREDRERERGKVWCIGIVQEKHSPESSWKERESKSENTSRGLNKKSVPQNHWWEARRGFQYHQDVINSGAQSLKFWSSVPSDALVRKQDESPEAGSAV